MDTEMKDESKKEGTEPEGEKKPEDTQKTESAPSDQAKKEE